jgi:hypothetical protein
MLFEFFIFNVSRSRNLRRQSEAPLGRTADLFVGELSVSYGLEMARVRFTDSIQCLDKVSGLHSTLSRSKEITSKGTETLGPDMI